MTDDIVGYTYKAENYTVLGMRERLIKDGLLAVAARGMSFDDALHQASEANGFDLDEPESYDTDEWPKPIWSFEATQEEIESWIAMDDQSFTDQVFTMTINAHGAAFGEGPFGAYDRAQEIGRLLELVSTAVSLDGRTEGTLVDSWGNTCGTFKIEDVS